MTWQIAAWILLGGSTVLLFLGLPVAFTFLVINLVGAMLWLVMSAPSLLAPIGARSSA